MLMDKGVFNYDENIKKSAILNRKTKKHSAAIE